MRWRFLVCLIGFAVPLTIGAAPAEHARPAPGTPVHPGHQRSAEFDDKAALRLSQAAIGRELGDHVLRDREGKNVRLSAYRGKPLVISLVYTSCYHICPTTTRHLAKVARTARHALGEASIEVVTIGFDTPRDTPEAMRQFARQHGVDDEPGWAFLSADADTMERLTRDLGFVYFASPKGFDHLIQATVVDARGKIYRQVYGMNFDTPLLVEPLKELAYGAEPNQSLVAGLIDRVRLFCTTYDPSSDRYRFDYSLFIGMGIGLMILGGVSAFLIREYLRSRARRTI